MNPRATLSEHFRGSDDSSQSDVKHLSDEDNHLSKLDSRVRKQLLRQAFYILDENYTGTLERDEVHRFGHFMFGDDWSDYKTHLFLQEADLDMSGDISFDEFATFCEQHLLCDASKH